MFSPIAAIEAVGSKTRSLIGRGCLGLAVAGVLGAAVPAHAGIFGASFETTDYYNVTTDHDTPSTVNVNNFQVTIEGILNGDMTVYDQTFSVPFSDASVQQGVLAAQAALLAQGSGAITGPTLSTNTTTLQGSSTTDVITGSHAAPDYSPSGEIVTHAVAPQVVTLHELAAPGDYTDPLVTHTFVPIIGGEDINTSVPIVLTIDRNVITTDTFLTTQLYVLTANVTPAPSVITDPADPTLPPGNPPDVTLPPTPVVPLPAEIWPATSLLSALGLRKWIKSI